MVRIRSAHAIGFLKGRFQSLKGMRVCIGDEASHKFAAYWAAACINLHAFALQCDEERDGENGERYPEDDPFIAEGLNVNSSDEEVAVRRQNQHHAEEQRSCTWLSVAKTRREKIKKALLQAKQRQWERQKAELLDLE